MVREALDGGLWRRCGVEDENGPPVDHDWGAESRADLRTILVGADGFEPPTSAL